VTEREWYDLAHDAVYGLWALAALWTLFRAFK
jgi:hypothetical protein